MVHASAICCLSVEGTRVHLQKLVSSLSKAWELVHERLPEHGEKIVSMCYIFLFHEVILQTGF